MKIGIITQPLHTNYGGLLQNYALQKVLKKLGHNPITLDQGYPNPLWRVLASYIKTLILKSIGKGENRKYPSLCTNEKHKLYIRQHTDYFINKYITHTIPFLYAKDFRNYTINSQLDALIVGSDQVWRPIYNPDVLRSFFDFAKGVKIKKLAYAASFGVDFWEFNSKQSRGILKLIRDFKAVSVREKSGVDLCKSYLHVDATHVLDPTMLLDKEDYISLVMNENEPLSKGDLFTYILDDSEVKRQYIDEIASELNLVPFTSMAQDADSICPPVTQWLRSFMDAKFVVCDSFHGAVFSIIFNKPFMIIGNKERGMTRFNSLLETFKLKNRMVDNLKDVHTIINTPIDWDKINQIRTGLKIISIDFLNNNLNK